MGLLFVHYGQSYEKGSSSSHEAGFHPVGGTGGKLPLQTP